MGTASFFFGSFALGIVGAKVLASFESVPSERIGAEGFLFFLCLAASAFSTLCYAESSRRFTPRPRWFVALLGGFAAAVAFCGSVSMVYTERLLGLDLFLAWLLLALALPSLVGWCWPFLIARLSGHHSPN
jgi:hypothetical protein